MMLVSTWFESLSIASHSDSEASVSFSIATESDSKASVSFSTAIESDSELSVTFSIATENYSDACATLSIADLHPEDESESFLGAIESGKDAASRLSISTQRTRVATEGSSTRWNGHGTPRNAGRGARDSSANTLIGGAR